MDGAKRARGRPRIHPSWTDSEGKSRALRDHPNFDVCRNFRARSEDSDADAEHVELTYGVSPARLLRSGSDADYRLVSEWCRRENLAAFVYGVAAEIGFRPDRYYDLKPVDPAKPIGPGNVQWRKRPDPATDKAVRYRKFRAGRTVKLPGGGYLFGSEADGLTHRAGCESSHLPPIECQCCSAEVERATKW